VANGDQPPVAVVEATADLLDENDLARPFIEACLLEDADALTPLKDMEAAIKKYLGGIVVDDDARQTRIMVAIAGELLERLKLWKQTTEFPGNDDWIFASPLKLGRLPYSYSGFRDELDRTGKQSGVGHIGTHTFRHSFRMWIDAAGTTVGVHQKLMRHASITTTMNIYGDAASADMREAHGKIVRLALKPD
jgi:integrase